MLLNRLALLFCVVLLHWSHDAASLTLEEAAHLLRRTGFGPTPAEVELLLPLDRGQAVERVLGGDPEEPAIAPPAWVEEPPPPPAVWRRADETQRRALMRRLRLRSRELQAWWYRQMVACSHPLRERMTLFWHGHFTSALQKVRHPPLLFRQNRLFRQQALGSFANLLQAVLHDPAMLLYLDNVSNRRGSPNENLARELLELFTLGRGQYSEADIKAAARALTGYSIDRRTGAFRFRRAWHDDGVKTFLGRTGRWDADDLVRILLRQEQTARFITGKLWREFVSPEPEAREVERLAGQFRDTGYDLRALLRELLLTPAFWDPANRGTLVRSPTELLVGTARLLELQDEVIGHFPALGRRLGQSLFNPPGVAGWPGGERWIDTQTLTLRETVLERAARLGRLRSSLAGWLRGNDPGQVRALLLPLSPLEAEPRQSGWPLLTALLLDPVHQLK